jgi:large subunit ribosomal protein L3
MRTGMIAKKEGMTRIFDEDGRQIPVTVLKVEGCQVVSVRTDETDGYTAVQLGAGVRKASRTNKAQKGHFAKAKVAPKQKIAEFRVTQDNLLEVGAELSVNHYVEGQFVDVIGTTKGKGFQGAMKRWNFGGMRATHGVSISHRALGSTGQCQDPGKVFKGKKMAGQMGNVRQTTQSLKVVGVDLEEGLILIKGAVPGANKGWVLIQDSEKKALVDNVPFPAGLKADDAPAVEVKAEDAVVETEAPVETPAENKE